MSESTVKLSRQMHQLTSSIKKKKLQIADTKKIVPPCETNDVTQTVKVAWLERINKKFYVIKPFQIFV